MENKTVKLLLYCTVAKPYLAHNLFAENTFGTNYKKAQFSLYSFKPMQYDKDISLNGKIVAEAECDLVEEIKFINDTSYGTNTLNQNELLKKSCLGMFDLYEYLYIKDGYAIYLKNVKPFEEPKELSDYYQQQKSCMNSFGWLVDSMNPIKKATQNMCYAYDKDGNLYVLISIKSPYMCDIMNDKKTIEVRTSILNLLKEVFLE